ncbi:ABC-2 transporter permease [Paenibacillus sp. MMO-177]|uniref:ABC-2 transporter permease n=1 Tax=Paenibacillus sp. MMO-177 TaxID=3081289 RepID=UPI0030179148
MFNLELFKYLAKSHFKSFAIITVSLLVLISIIMTVFDPSTIADIAAASKDAPVNPLGDITTLIAFVANQYFGNFVIILGIIYSVITANKLVAEQVDKGSMAYHLSMPVTRVEMTATSALYLFSSLAAMFLLIFGVGWSVAEFVQPGELPVGIFFTLTWGAFLLHAAIASVVFLASCLFNRSSRALALGAGLAVFFFAADLLSSLSSSLEWMHNLTIITLLDIDAIISGGSYGIQLFVLAAVSCSLTLIGITIFKRKDLPI